MEIKKCDVEESFNYLLNQIRRAYLTGGAVKVVRGCPLTSKYLWKNVNKLPPLPLHTQTSTALVEKAINL